AGVPAAAALRAGSLWYVAMLALGTIVAGLLAQRTRNDAFVVAIPPAFAVFGGTFIHVTQIAAALPAAALLVAYAPRERRVLAVIALLALAVPWGWFDSPALLLAALFPIAYLAWRYWPGNLVPTLLAAVAAAVLLFGVESLHASAAPHVAAHAVVPAIDPRLPEASWSAFAQKSSTGGFAAWAVRIPTWTGLALLLVLAASAAGPLRLRASHALALALAALGTLLPIAAQSYADRSSGWLMVDFRAYYCAALAQRDGFSPYYVQPLHDCERATPKPFYHPPAKVTVPAPYPPYALALFSPLTLFSFETAATIWWMLLAAAIGVAAYALSRVARQPLPVAWAALALSLGLTSFSSGNVMPLAVAAIVVAALCAACGRLGPAAFAIAVAAVEPQIALPAALGLFVAYSAMRIPLCVAGLALAALSVWSGGLTQTVAYVTAVLPAHALAEVSRDNQYSLSAVLAALGVPDASAALAGSLSYTAMVALGAFVAVRLARRYDNAAFAALVPPAFALIGGTFVHTEAIAAAVPACLLAYSFAPAQRAWLFVTLLLVAVPWMMATSAALFLAPLFPVAYLAYALWRDRTVALAAAVASLALIAGLFAVAQVPVHALAHAHAFPPIDPQLAEASWRQFVLGNVTNRPAMWLLRAPTWIGVIAFALAAFALSRRPVFSLTPEAA
ncbi:MAG TPA: glycosyltransferase 87 family protein, partial [Candidatus Cybelea sp.]